MKKLLIHLPEDLKARLDVKRAEGYTASGFIRSLLERELKKHIVKGTREVKRGTTRTERSRALQQERYSR